MPVGFLLGDRCSVEESYRCVEVQCYVLPIMMSRPPYAPLDQTNGHQKVERRTASACGSFGMNIGLDDLIGLAEVMPAGPTAFARRMLH